MISLSVRRGESFLSLLVDFMLSMQRGASDTVRRATSRSSCGYRGREGEFRSADSVVATLIERISFSSGVEFSGRRERGSVVDAARLLLVDERSCSFEAGRTEKSASQIGSVGVDESSPGAIETSWTEESSRFLLCSSDVSCREKSCVGGTRAEAIHRSGTSPSDSYSLSLP